MLPSNVKIMRRFVEQVINKGDFAFLNEVIHPNYVYRSPDQVLKGPNALRELFAAYRAAFPDLHIQIEELVSAGNNTLMFFTLSGTHEGDLMGIAATGRAVKVKGMTLSHFENGKIVDEWELLDQLNLLRQLGVALFYRETCIGSNEERAMRIKADNDQAYGGITLVVGGTGKTGRRVAERLQARGIQTRIASRSSNPSFDWNDPSNWNTVLDGVTAAYITYAPDLAIPGATSAIASFIDLAKKSDVKHIVLLSGRGETEAQACEKIIQESGIDWTIVRASWFYQNFSEGAFLDMVLSGNISLPARAVKEPFVDIDDIADVVVTALTQAGHCGEIYEVTGPRLMSFYDIADELSSATGRKVTYTEVKLSDFAEYLKSSGASKEISWLLEYLFTTVLDGRNEYLSDGIQRALGRPPRDFKDFVKAQSQSGVWDIAA